MKGFARLSAALVLVAACSLPLSAKVKYVFYIIGDGMSINAATATGLYNGGIPVNFCTFPVRTTVSTYSANKLVTDSAAAGTALACGVKTNNRCEGVTPDGTPVESIVVKAGKAGWGSAVVSNCEIVSATPAAFLFHNVTRKNADQMTAATPSIEGVDFIACHNIYMRDKSRTEQVLDSIRHAGWTVFTGKDAFHPVPGKVIYRADSLGAACAYAIERTPEMVSLEELSRAALEQMTSKYMKKGFIIAIESGEVDHPCHSNDAGATFVEINDMAKTVDLALDFYRRHSRQTLIVVTSDHETGGMSFEPRRVEDIQKLHCQKMSMRQITKHLKTMRAENPNTTWEEVKAFLSDALGLWSVQEVSEKEEAVLKGMFDAFSAGNGQQVKDLYNTNEQLANEAVKYLAYKCGVNWGAYGHTGANVGLYVIGAGSEEFVSCKDNTDIPKAIEKVTGIGRRKK